jgi:hypothetical protein
MLRATIYWLRRSERKRRRSMTRLRGCEDVKSADGPTMAGTAASGFRRSPSKARKLVKSRRRSRQSPCPRAARTAKL